MSVYACVYFCVHTFNGKIILTIMLSITDTLDPSYMLQMVNKSLIIHLFYLLSIPLGTKKQHGLSTNRV